MAAVRQRRTDQFIVTLGGVEDYEGVREDFLLYFDDLQEYCVCLEYNHVNNKCHIHAYLKFCVLLSCVEVRNFLSWCEDTVNVQSVRSRRNVLKYITKEDRSPLFNCRLSELSFSYRAFVWASGTRTFRFSDSFVLEHPQYYRLLQELHSEVQHGRVLRQSDIANVTSFYPGWGLEVLLQIRRQFQGLDRRGLYVYGQSGIGKTFIVREVFKALGFQEIFMPVPGHFFFGDFEASRYDSVLFEEFEFETFKSNFYQIKQLLDRVSFPVDAKYRVPKYVRVKCPIVMVSNYSPYSEVSFVRRLAVINALEKLENVEKIIVPKEEVDGISEMEVIEIPSESDEESMEEGSFMEFSAENAQSCFPTKKVPPKTVLRPPCADISSKIANRVHENSGQSLHKLHGKEN